MGKNRSNAPSSKDQRGKVNAHVRDFAGFENIGGSVGGSGWESGKARPARGTGPSLSGSSGDSKGGQEGG